MKTEIELHDSELLRVDVEAGTLLIDAYIHRSGTEIRREGGYQHTIFKFGKLRIETKSVELSGDIYDWTILADGLAPNDLIPLPFETPSPVAIKIGFGNDNDYCEATFLGDGLIVEEAGPYRFVEFWRD